MLACILCYCVEQRGTLPYTCCTLYMLHFIHAALYTCCTLYMLHFIHAALYTCCTLYMLHFIHAALYTCCTLYMLHFWFVCTCMYVRVSIQCAFVFAGREEGEGLLQAAVELKNLLRQQCARLKEEVKEREELDPLLTAAMHQCWDQLQESEQNMEASCTSFSLSTCTTSMFLPVWEHCHGEAIFQVARKCEKALVQCAIPDCAFVLL